MSLRYLSNSCNETSSFSSKISIPSVFSISDNPDGCLDVFYKLIVSIHKSPSQNIILDFTRCKSIRIAALTILDLIIHDTIATLAKYNVGWVHKTQRKFKIIASNHQRVNYILHNFGYIDFDEKKAGNIPLEYLKLGLLSGRRGCYKENQKALACAKIVDYVNESLSPINACLKHSGRNLLEQLTSEILGNAEDHSPANSLWYVNGLSLHDNVEGEDIVHLNLAFVNFGKTMYEGFAETKDKNVEMYDKLESRYSLHSSLMSRRNSFSKESLYMLYMLNEGVSRLKYLEHSRGNGTMQFIEAFLSLGSYGNGHHKYEPKLNIISGNTVLTCDSSCAPYDVDSLKVISLNNEKDIACLPNKKYLRHFDGQPFPGTILECHIYLSRKHFRSNISNNNK